MEGILDYELREGGLILIAALDELVADAGLPEEVAKNFSHLDTDVGSMIVLSVIRGDDRNPGCWVLPRLVYIETDIHGTLTKLCVVLNGKSYQAELLGENGGADAVEVWNDDMAVAKMCVHDFRLLLEALSMGAAGVNWNEVEQGALEF